MSPDVTTTQPLLSPTSHISSWSQLRRRKEHFENSLNATNWPFMIEAELEDDGGSTSISLAEVNEVVKELHCDKAPETDNAEWLSWMTHLFNIAWKSGVVPKEWQTRVVVSGGFSISRRILWELCEVLGSKWDSLQVGLDQGLVTYLVCDIQGQDLKAHLVWNLQHSLICSKPSVKGLGWGLAPLNPR